jgi:hypothetical protein
MTLLDSRVSMMFEKMFIPVLDITECVLDVKYEGHQYRCKYPQDEPLVIPISDPFTREKNQMLITILYRTGKKYRKIAKGEINFYKKYFLGEKLAVEKWVYLGLYHSQLEQMGQNTSILKAVANQGKIYMRSFLIDPALEDGKTNPHTAKGHFPDHISVYTTSSHNSIVTQMLKNNLKNLGNVKDKAYANKTERFRSVTEHGNEFLRNLKNKKTTTITSGHTTRKLFFTKLKKKKHDSDSRRRIRRYRRRSSPFRRRF